jgi:hypothetical protein
MAQNEATVKGSIWRVSVKDVPPANKGVHFLIKNDTTGKVIAVTTCRHDEQIHLYEEGDVLVVTFIGDAIDGLRRLVSVAFLCEIRRAATTWLKEAVKATFTGTHFGPDSQPDVTQLDMVVAQLDSATVGEIDKVGVSLVQIQTLVDKLVANSTLATSHFMDEFLALVLDVLAAISLTLAASLPGRIEEDKFGEAIRHLNCVSNILPTAPPFPRLRQSA